MGPIHPRDKKPVGALDSLDGFPRLIAMKKSDEFYIDIDIDRYTIDRYSIIDRYG